MKKTYLVAVLAVTIISASACANKASREQNSSQRFETNIERDGSKRFVFTLTERQEANRGSGRQGANQEGRGGNRGGSGQSGNRERPQGGRDDQGGRAQQGAAGSQRTTENDKERIVGLLEAKISETAYCRHGYIELDYTSVRGEHEFKGECQESASDKDRQMF